MCAPVCGVIAFFPLNGNPERMSAESTGRRSLGLLRNEFRLGRPSALVGASDGALDAVGETSGMVVCATATVVASVDAGIDGVEEDPQAPSASTATAETTTLRRRGNSGASAAVCTTSL